MEPIKPANWKQLAWEAENRAARLAALKATPEFQELIAYAKEQDAKHFARVGLA